MILDASGMPISIKKQKKEAKKEYDAFHLPDGVAVSVKSFLLHAKKIESDPAYREKLEKASKITGATFPTLEFNRMNHSDRLRFLNNMTKGECFARGVAGDEGKNRTTKMYVDIDRK